MFSVKLESESFLVKQEDADHLIVTSAIAAAEELKWAVLVGKDIDLLIILTELASPSANIFFLKPGKGNSLNNLLSVSSFKCSQCMKK
ncbi:hypothetical protein AVEN_235242-1 [Araneus ventricosus]|uniref:NYN domain-containing protein n=1 Tax=Araneus ventricosus TaxID=182803 RepID=A0A4Y2A3X2_ARAVE|nr:hypothetical protein AVEN_235242-1 [Araneus ventricosus]